MMELTDSNAKAEAARPGPLGIDLNEIPSPPQAETLAADLDSADLVRSFHYSLQPPPGPAAGVPGEGRAAVCGACGRAEVKGDVVVCDGCERGFHLGCAGMQGGRQGNWEWVCVECSNVGVNSKRWPLGVKSKHILDINASPPSDGDGVEELQVSRKHTRGDNSFGGNPFGAPVTYSNLLYTENGYGFQKASGIVKHGITVGFQDVLHPAQGKSLEEVGYTFGKISNLGVMLPPQNPGEILQALRDFISERRGVLGDGWRVEFKQSVGSCGLCAIYCSPDGKIFDSMSEVARYLGLMSNCSSPSPAVARSTVTHDRLQPYKRRKLTKISNVNANGFPENKETIKCDNYKDLPSGHIMGSCTSKLLNDVKATEAGMQENIASESQQANDGFPVQFEDFFVLSSGTVDVRPPYHDANFIWPVGYRSCWHDKVTGSLFWCEVFDGGDSGPVFKVRRQSCSTSLVPIGSTVLVQSNTFQCARQTNGESDDMNFHSVDYDNDGSVQMMLVDPSPPFENEVLSCLGGSFSEHCTVGTSSSLQFEGISGNGGSENLLSSHDSSVKDVVGEISVEERSPALAWRSLSQKFIAACSEICKEGKLKFICKHVGNETCSPYSDIMDNNRKASFSSLAKFCSSQHSVRTPSVLQGDREQDSVLLALEKWLNQDRFGLDAEFVLEIIEQLPDVKCCSQYKCLKERSGFPSSLTVGSGFLMINTHAGLQSSKRCRLFGEDKKTKLTRDRHMDYPRPHPPGKPMGSRLPPQLVGDVYQVWELLWRFHEILGLNRPFSLEELEEELINPWSDRSGLVENHKSRIQGNQSSNLHDFGGTIGQAASTDTESGTVASREGSHAFIQMETGKMKEAAQCGITNFTCGRYFGKALIKAHNALLKVLVTELQSKVAALVDPTFDAGESKTKRGRKKEGDSSLSARRTKLNMLPINELTWPELARRYILAVISMDGNLDSAEITARESVKVFRCLQGDGGLLCGSLTGVAGMEADALLLAEASKKIFASPSKESDVLTVEDEGFDASGACEKSAVNDVIIPEWAKVLEPVRKLPTNVGTRIRKCVYEALEKGPPEWAKEILEHSISKEVYKGNASGPTKKAVLSLLANVCSEGLLPRPEKKKKKKTVISVSDIIMKQCRIVLRHAAAADDAKVFCNLLGRKPISSSDNDDEGFLGSPGTVSRPLDFRTIDLRLAVGAYGGSHEAFLEDVRELWCIVRAAYADQPDLVELAETLSQNFESMYEKEVVILAEKFVEFVKSDSLSAETKKEIIDIVASINEMPKAPWDEGVCKVCGIDRDDDSVLLCDTCDAEYHTYCLNPPLARIPEGNWYCPSCAAKRMVKDASERTQIIGLHRGKKYQGEVSRVYLESLARLADMMEQKEYWEFTVEERTSLLKFLCDDLLCSSLLRQHLEQCAETSVELQQRLRSLSIEWRNLKSKEETLSARAAKEISTFNSTRESSIKERHASPVTNHVKSVGQTNILSDNSLSYATGVSGDLTPSESNQEGSGRNGIEKPSTCKSPIIDAVNTEDRSEDRHVIADGDVQDNTTTPMYAEADEQSSTMDESASSEPLLPEKDDSCREIPSQGKLHQGMDRHTQPTTEQEENCLQPGTTSNQITQNVPPVTPNEPQSYQLELNSVRNDILLLEDSITIVVSELLKSSIRREFLGVDSNGRMYWASASLDRSPQVIVDGSLAIQQRRKVSNKQLLHIGSARWNSVLSGVDDYLNAEGSKAHCPYLHESNTAMPMGNCSPWGCYQTDSEIKELVCWLKDNDPRERELKDSIMNWQKVRFSESQQTSNQGPDPLTALSVFANNEQTALASFVTKAATLLEKKYGPCHDAETTYTDSFKKRGKKAKVMYGEKMYRCECLEPIWPSRYHCSFCHITLSSDTELEGHTDCKCSSGSPASEKKKVNGSLTGKGILRSEIIQDECADEMMSIGKASKTGSIKFKENKAACPYNFDEICSKFVTNNSNKELVQEIGLLGSNGVPSFLPSISPFTEGSAFMYDISGTLSMPIGKQGFPSENGSIANSGLDCITDASSTREKLKNDQQAFRCSGQRKFSLDGRCSVVPQSSLRPLIGKISHISKSLKANLLDMDAALPEEALRPSKTSMGRRNAWRAFVKSSETIFEMVQATIVLENMIRAEYLRNEWWYWSSLTAAAKTSTMSSLALRIYSLDAAIIYEKTMPEPDPTNSLKPGTTPDDKPLPSPDPAEKTVRVTRKSSKKRKEPE